MNFVLITRNCVTKTRNFAFKMMNFAGGTPKTRTRRASLNSQVINHLAGEVTAEAKARAAGMEEHEIEGMPANILTSSGAIQEGKGAGAIFD